MEPQNPYSSPLAVSGEASTFVGGEWPLEVGGLWRDEKFLVARRDASFPMVCPATNQPAIAKVAAYFPWARKDLYPLRFGLVVGALYYLTQVKHTLLQIPITAQDARSRTWRLIVGVVGGVGALVLIGLLFAITTNQAQMPRKAGQTFLEREGKVLVVTGCAFACIMTTALVLHGMPDPTKSLPVHGVWQEKIWLSGAHPDYLDRLTAYEGERPQGT